MILFPDAQLATRDLLRALLADRTEPYAADVTVSTRVPDTKADGTPSLPLVVVRTGGNVRDGRLNGRATVRVSVWHRDEGLGLQLSALCEGLLLASGSAEVRSYGPVSSPVPTSDPDTGDPLATFAVTARLAPVQVDGPL